MLDTYELVIGELSFYNVYLRVLHVRAVALTEHLYTLRRRIRTLVELPGQELHRKHTLVIRKRGQFLEYLINGRLGEYRRHRLLEILLRQTLNVVTVDYAHALDRLHSQNDGQVLQHSRAVYGKQLFLFHINSINHFLSP